MFEVGEIVWGRMRGFPWWPARVVTPTPDQLSLLSVSNIPPDHRLVWFFNDGDRYTLLNVKSLSCFSNQQLTVQTKNKTGKSAAKLKLAFKQAAAEHRSAKSLEKEDAVQAVLVAPSNSTPAPTTKRSYKSQPPASPVSKRKSAAKVRQAADDESERLSTQFSPSPSDRSSHHTANDSRSTGIAPKRNMLRLRIREPRPMKAQHEDDKRVALKKRRHPPPEKPCRVPMNKRLTEDTQIIGGSLKEGHSGVCLERRKRVTKPSLKLRQDASPQDVHRLKRRSKQASHGAAKRIKLESSALRSTGRNVEIKREVNDKGADDSLADKGPLSESTLGIQSQRVPVSERTNQSVSPVRRSGRIRQTASRITASDEECDGDRESEDQDETPVGSKRSRGVEAPRLSDGQRRVHIRQERKADPRTSRKEDTGHRIHPTQPVKRLGVGSASDRTQKLAGRPFEALTKEDCVTMICGMQEALRHKNVRIWLLGKRVASTEEVKRTEKDVTQACEKGIGKAEKLLGWAKRHQGYESGPGSKFFRMEERAVQECKGLIDVYFDRRKVSLRDLGCRVLKLTKELPSYSRRLTSVLEEILVLWVDLTSGRT